MSIENPKPPDARPPDVLPPTEPQKALQRLIQQVCPDCGDSVASPGHYNDAGDGALVCTRVAARPSARPGLRADGHSEWCKDGWCVPHCPVGGAFRPGGPEEITITEPPWDHDEPWRADFDLVEALFHGGPHQTERVALGRIRDRFEELTTKTRELEGSLRLAEGRAMGQLRVSEDSQTRAEELAAEEIAIADELRDEVERLRALCKAHLGQLRRVKAAREEARARAKEGEAHSTAGWDLASQRTRQWKNAEIVRDGEKHRADNFELALVAEMDKVEELTARIEELEAGANDRGES